MPISGWPERTRAAAADKPRQDVTNSLHASHDCREIFLESLSTGVITEHEVNWPSHQASFDRPEEAAAIRLGRLMDQGQINLGCRLPEPMLHHQTVLVDWIEPLGRRRHRAMA